jgi:hypothetical protein
MKKTVFAAVAMLTLAGCASAPSGGSSATNVSFDYPAAVVQKAAVNALSVTGFDIQKSDPTYVEGFRPRKVGLFVGSGGETVGVWIQPVSASKTTAKVETEKSLVGIVGQKNWDDEVIDAMRSSLSRQ